MSAFCPSLLVWKRAANGAALLASACALALWVMLWATVRAGCSTEGAGGLSGGLLELARAGEPVTRQLQGRVRGLEQALEDFRLEKFEARFERETLIREKAQIDLERSRMVQEKEEALEEAQQGLYLDSLVFGQYLKAHAKQLEAWWRARLGPARRRGIVMSAGGTVPLTNAFVTLRVLRFHLNCTLPAVVMYWGSAKGDSMDPAVLPFFKQHLPGVEFVDASRLPYPPHHRPLSPERPNGEFAGWKVKVFSIYAAPFQEVLYLDSDSTPLLDPSHLFASSQYRRMGNLFWPDFYAGDTPWIKAEKLFEVLRIENPWAGKPNMRDFSLNDLARIVKEAVNQKGAKEFSLDQRWTEADVLRMEGGLGLENERPIGRRPNREGDAEQDLSSGGGSGRALLLQGAPWAAGTAAGGTRRGGGGADSSSGGRDNIGLGVGARRGLDPARGGGSLSSELVTGGLSRLSVGGGNVATGTSGGMSGGGVGGSGSSGAGAIGTAASGRASGGSSSRGSIGGSGAGRGSGSGGSRSAGSSRDRSPWVGGERPQEVAPRQTETGQLLLDKTRHWEVLEWLLFLNSHNEVTYRTVHGDKDTFRAAFHLAGKAKEFQMVPHFPALSLTDTVSLPKRYHQRGVMQLSPRGALMFHHKAGPLGKFEIGRMELPPATTHITARASADLGTACVFSGAISNEEIGGFYEVQVDLITPQACNYSMLDWPAAERRCAPSYSPMRPGFEQLMPIFEVTPGSHVAAAEVAAEAAFMMLQDSGVFTAVTGLGDMSVPWDRK